MAAISKRIARVQGHRDNFRNLYDFFMHSMEIFTPHIRDKYII
uniref:Ribose-phosphate pyrophosphokinase n=1 Tax=uncultured bacterium pAG2 TaxID=1781152 RepID=A0A1C9U4H9_9BACT|nr:ribose-phosphate pyrophosphokinase [uncultured bacterium pAG2]